MILEGYAATQIVDQIFDKIVEMEALSDKQKAVICEKMAVRDFI